ncbi:MAG TPA: triose-phosphate isomerase [Candidatus Dormibacteraeota bacterium]|nr:triose-phosphate isomerase [Candidatus Dormibacteraeota bacterium]
MKHYTIVGNWKMHFGQPEAAVKYVKKLHERVKPHTHVTSVVAPPFTALAAVAEEVESDTFKVAAQNLHECDEGAYTGEISAPMLKGLARYVIVGHSERRRYEHETDKQIAKKVAAAVRCDLTAILCVGEKLDDRQEGHSKRVVVDQLHGALSQVAAEDIKDIIIAYEPVWAIGTGEYAEPEEVRPVVNVIRQTVEEMFGRDATSGLRILYGGSVEPDNCKAYLQAENISGLLVGGASINYEQFSRIVKIAQHLADSS